MDFEEIWTTDVARLSGETIKTFRGKENKILSVSMKGIMRTTSEKPEPSLMPIEPFRWAVDRLLTTGRVTRHEIDSKFTTDGCSSGVFAVLSLVPLFEVGTDSLATLHLRKQDKEKT
ncbi:MAG: hypothetical protein ABIE70_01710 [bacterium]